jgi:hypothetical protein
MWCESDGLSCWNDYQFAVARHITVPGIHCPNIDPNI